MKLNFQDVKVERSSAFQSQQFDIGNKRIIMEILRGKMYSNPIQTICQEISSNARDAHKEVKKENVPIEIKLPNRLEPSFWIRDFGPGITPERMADVFIKYGNSTKRDDNNQIGGFGLGAKSPFSYTDTFTVISITPEDNKLVRREYLAHIDESGLGQMSCVKEGPTTEQQGTTVLFYPKPTDFATFAIYTKRVTSHWPVRPTILGDPDFQWPEIKVAYNGQGWEIHDASPLEQVPYAIIEGIPYNLNLRHIYPAGHAQLSHLSLRLLFKIGEIPVTANREEIDYQSSVIALIKDKLEKALEEFRTQLTTNLANAKTLRAAVLVWQELRRKPYGSLLGQTTWTPPSQPATTTTGTNGTTVTIKKNPPLQLSLYESIITGNQPETAEIIISHFRRDSYTAYGCRKMSDYNRISVAATSLLIEEDLKSKGIARARLATLFDKYPKVTHIDVIDFSKKYEKETLKNGDTITKIAIVDDTVIANRKKAAEKEFNYSLLEPIQLSTIDKKKIVFEATGEKKKYKSVKVKKLTGTTEDDCQWAEVDESVLENKKPKLYVILSNKMTNWRDDSKLSLKDTFRLISHLNRMIKLTDPTIKVSLEVYGVLPSYAAKLESHWQPFYPVAEKIITKYKEILPTQFGSDYALSRRFNHWLSDLILKSKIKDKLAENSLMLSYIKESQSINDSADKVGLYNDMCNYFNQNYMSCRPENQKELKKLYEAVGDKYPLLLSLTNYGTYNNSVLEDEVLLYILSKDNKTDPN